MKAQTGFRMGRILFAVCALAAVVAFLAGDPILGVINVVGATLNLGMSRLWKAEL